MTILFASSNIEDYRHAVLYESPSAASWVDSAYTASMPLKQGMEASHYVMYPYAIVELDGRMTEGNTLWYHVRLHSDVGFSTGSGTAVAVQYLDVNGLRLAEVRAIAEELCLTVYGDTTVTTPPGSRYFMPGVDTTLMVDVSLQVTLTDIYMNLYIDGVLTLSETTTNTTANRTKADCLYLCWGGWFSTWLSWSGISENIITDNEDTRGWRLATLQPSAAGPSTQWIGDWTSLQGFEKTDYIEVAQTGLRESWELSNYFGPASPASIRGVFVNYNAWNYTEDAGPQAVQPFLRIGGVDYDAPANPVIQEPRNYLGEWTVNPATGLAWTTAAFNALIAGLRSA